MEVSSYLSQKIRAKFANAMRIDLKVLDTMETVEKIMYDELLRDSRAAFDQGL